MPGFWEELVYDLARWTLILMLAMPLIAAAIGCVMLAVLKTAALLGKNADEQNTDFQENQDVKESVLLDAENDPSLAHERDLRQYEPIQFEASRNAYGNGFEAPNWWKTTSRWFTATISYSVAALVCCWFVAMIYHLASTDLVEAGRNYKPPRRPSSYFTGRP